MATTDRPTSFDIAALAGVSQPTVSRALRGDRTVSEATRLRVEAVARQLNYKVDKRASSLRQGASRTLALLFFEDPIPDGSRINPFFLSMLGSILATCAARGYDLLTSFQHLDDDWHAAWQDSRKADGLILLGYGDYTLYRRRLEALVTQGTCFVRWGTAEPDGLGGGTIGCDNRAGGLAAGRHLIGRGRRRIAFLGDASGHYPEFRDRWLGLADAHAEAGLSPDPALRLDATSREDEGRAAASRLIARGVDFDAIFAASDMIALGAIRVLEAAGRRVPQDVSVVGFDDIPAAALAHPPLTTVAQNYARAGETLVDALVDRIANRPTPAMVLETQLIVRQSS